MTEPPAPPWRRALFASVVFSGAGGLLWEVLWQQRTAIALGVSAFGAAITVASMMAGFALGGFLVARRARRTGIARPLAGFGVAELIVGVSALLVAPGLELLALVDTQLWAMSPWLAATARLLGTALLLVVPSTAMGATLPLLAAIARAAHTTIGKLYALNTLGAVLGILLGTFGLIPLLGLFRTGLLTAAIDFGVALWALRPREVAAESLAEASMSDGVPRSRLTLAFVSGLVIFALEVAWFRAVHAAYQSSTETFGILLAAFLLPLSFGASLAPRLRRRWPQALPSILALAAFCVLCVAPAIDALDQTALVGVMLLLPAWRFLQLLIWVGAPLTLLGLVFPWLLESQPGASGAGALYTANTIGAVVGALGAGFLSLPAIGATRTSWLAAAILLVVVLAQGPWRVRIFALGATLIGLAVALHFDSGGGRRRIQGGPTLTWGAPIFVSEGPDATVSVGEEVGTGTRDLVIDGFEASTDSREAHYMRWMGHLPALAAGVVHDALVICFGTGQTADAVRQHGPQTLDIVDVSPAVLRAGPLFRANHDVLHDPRVHATVMDGRAYLRRARNRSYDLVTLEPMPPNFAGVNNLYSREFYALVRARLRDHGIAAQWVPIHLLPPAHMVAVIATFLEAFPHSRLWIDPVESTCILVGGTQPWQFSASTIPLDLDAAAIERGIILDETQLSALSEIGNIITDDNQLLAYGNDRLLRYRYDAPTGGQGLSDVNRAILSRVAAGK